MTSERLYLIRTVSETGLFIEPEPQKYGFKLNDEIDSKQFFDSK